MGCCGNKSSQSASASASGGSTVTGYLVQLPDGRQATYLTAEEAEQARVTLGAKAPVQPVYKSK
jgi:hypothetical protein